MNEDTYIQCMKDQIDSGVYDPLFKGKRDLVFLDIGANIGLVSIYAVPYCKRIVAIEPAPDTFAKLKENTRNYPMIECLDVALSPEYGKQEFYLNDLNFTASSTVNTYGTKTYVTGVTLSDILEIKKLGHVDVCKIDAEGGEGESLSLHELDACKNVIKTYYIEFHNCPKTSWEHKMGTIVGNLARLGYKNMRMCDVDDMCLTATRP